MGMHGWAIVGTSADAPGSALELLRDPQGQLHVGLGFLHTHPDLDGFLDQTEAAEDQLRNPTVPGIAPLVQRDPDHATFVYPVPDGALLSTFLQVRTAMGQPAGPRAAVELLQAIGQLLGSVGDGTAPDGLASHGGVHPWRVMVHPTGSITMVGYGLPSFEIEEHTPALRFLPPERLWEEQLDMRADIYTAGVCAAELALGAPLLEGPSEKVEALILDGEVPRRVEAAREHLGSDVADLLLACVAPEPSNRIDAGADLQSRAEALLPELADHPSLFELVSPLSRPENEGRRLLDVQRGLRILDGIQAFFSGLMRRIGGLFRRDDIDLERAAAIPFDTSDEAPTVAFEDPDAVQEDGVVVVARNLLEPTRDAPYRLVDEPEAAEEADANEDEPADDEDPPMVAEVELVDEDEAPEEEVDPADDGESLDEVADASPDDVEDESDDVEEDAEDAEDAEDEDEDEPEAVAAVADVENEDDEEAASAVADVEDEDEPEAVAAVEDVEDEEEDEPEAAAVVEAVVPVEEIVPVDEVAVVDDMPVVDDVPVDDANIVQERESDTTPAEPVAAAPINDAVNGVGLAAADIDGQVTLPAELPAPHDDPDSSDAPTAITDDTPPAPSRPWADVAQRSVHAAQVAARSADGWLDAGRREVRSPMAGAAVSAQLKDLEAEVECARAEVERATALQQELEDADASAREALCEQINQAAKRSEQASSNARRALFRLRDALAEVEAKEASIRTLLREANLHATSAAKLVVEVEETEGALVKLIEADASLSQTIEPTLKRLRFAATWAQRAAQRTQAAAAKAQAVTSAEDAQSVVEEAKKALDDTIAAWRRVGKENQRARRRIGA